MENVGCVTLRDEYLFRSRVTTASLDYRRNTILHELSHMWFGDLVTMRWWDDLWLKESFATWSANFAVSEQADDPELAWAAFCSQLQDLGLPPGPAALDPPGGRRHRRPGGRRAELRPDHLRQGRRAAGPAGVLRRPRRLPGRGAGLLHQARLRQHRAGRPAGEPERASGRDLSRWSAQWLETAGVNTLRLELTSDAAGRDHLRSRGADRPGPLAHAARAPDRARPVRRHRRAAGPDRPGRDRRRRSAYAGARPRRSPPARRDRGQRRGPELRQGPPGSPLAGHGGGPAADHRQPADPGGAAGARCGTPAATPSCRRRRTSTWSFAACRPRPMPPPCATSSARRASPRTAMPRPDGEPRSPSSGSAG